MAEFCTIADMAAFLQITIPADSEAAARAILEASAAIQNHCRQQLALVEDEAYIFDVPGYRTKLFLPELPVTEVSAVVENGTALVADDDYKLGRGGILYRLGGYYWYPGVQTVTVTYSHGYATIPQDVKDICVRAASRSYQSGLKAAQEEGLPGVQATQLGDYSVTYAEPASGSGGGGLGASAAPLLLPSEMRVLGPYRLKGA